jgi:hypothetical protein
MARVGINTGSTANDGTGDSLRAAGGIINSNFTEIYSQLGDGTNLSATWEKTSAGINSTANVGIGTTNPQFQLEVGYAGVADTSLFVHGNARVTGILTVGASSIVIDGSKNEVLIGTGVSLNGATGIISATQVYAGGTLLTGGSGGSADSFWVEEGSTGITTTKNVGIATDSAPSALTVGGQSLLLGITTFRENVILSNPNSGASNNLNFGGDTYIDQSSGDTFTFQINTGSDTNTTDGSFVFRNTEPNTDPIPDFQLDALRIYTRGDYWNGMVRSYTDFHADQNAFVGGDLQVGAASTLIGAGNTLGSFKVGAGGTVISTSASGLVGIGSSVPSVELDVSGNVSVSSSVTAATFYGDGQYLSNIGTAATADVRTNTFAASGVSTFSGHVALSTSLNVAGIVTAGDGLRIPGGTFADTRLELGNSQEFSFQYNTASTKGIVRVSSQDLDIEAKNIGLYPNNGENGVLAKQNGAVELYHANSKKFETTGAGVTVYGTTQTQQLNVSGLSTFNSNIRFDATGLFPYSETLNFGSNTSQEGQLFATSEYFYINSSADNGVYVQTNGFIELKSGTGSDKYIEMNSHPNHNGEVSLYYDGNKKLETSSSGIEVAGIVTAISGVSTFYGDVSKAAAGRWYLGAGAGNTSYFFTGIGFTNVDYAHNPVMHLARGQRYEFVNEMDAHPFQIQSGSIGGDPYDPGVTNNGSQNGTIAIEVPFNAPNQLFYQCTSHSGMGGTFTIYPSI